MHMFLSLIGIWAIKRNNIKENTKRKKTLNININEMKRRPIQISMAMEREEVAQMPEIAEAEMPGLSISEAEMPEICK